MAIYRIEWKSSALKELKHLDRSIIPKIIDSIQKLSLAPRPNQVRKLKGSDYSYRIRIGDYRVIYEIFDNVLLIIIVRIRHRKDVYNS